MKKDTNTSEKSKILMRTYITSLLSLMLCVTMLVGTSFAWFTSEVATSGNEIYVGMLKVDMVKEVDGKDVSLADQAALFGNTAEKVFRWEPGATQVETVKIVNKGDLSFHYGVYLSTIGADSDVERDALELIGQYIEVYTRTGDDSENYTTGKFDKAEWELKGTLAEVVKLGTKLTGDKYDLVAKTAGKATETTSDPVATVTIALHMKEETNDPDIMGMSVKNVGLKLIATQIDAESDAFGSDYDSDVNRAEVWDGTQDTEGLAANTDDAAKTVDIYTSEQLAAFAAKVNAGTTYAGYTVRLQSDLNLADRDWMPIGLNADESAKVFKGTFDGQNHTIYNLEVELAPAYRAAGLFGATQGTLKNFSVEGAKIRNTIVSGSGSSSNGTAVIAGSTAYGATISNVHVKKATVAGNRYVAGIVGYMDGTVEYCTVDGLILTATPDKIKDDPMTYDNGDKVGGIAGYVNSHVKATITNCRVLNSQINAFRDVGGIVGAGGQLDVFTGNHADTVTITYVAVPADGVMADNNVNKNAAELVGRDYKPDDTNTFANVTLPQ